MKNQYLHHYSREAQIRAETINEDDRSIEGVLSTETPVTVFDWGRFEPIREILLMDGVDLPKRVPLLNAHSRFSTSDVIGTTKNFRKDVDTDGKPIIVARNYFSKTEEKVYTKAKEGHLTDTSIGYIIDPEESVVLGKGEMAEISGRSFKNDSDMTMVIRKKWKLKENSLVPIGADQRAKLRSEFQEEPEKKVEKPSKVARSLKMNRNIHKHLKNLTK